MRGVREDLAQEMKARILTFHETLGNNFHSTSDFLGSHIRKPENKPCHQVGLKSVEILELKYNSK